MPGFALQSLPIGLDSDGDAVRLLQLSLRTGGGPAAYSVAAAAVEPIVGNSATAVGVAVRRAMATHRFAGREVVACLPRSVVHVRSVRVPGPVDDTFDSRVFDAVAPLFPFPVESARVQVVSAGPVRDGDKPTCEAIVLAVRHEDVDAFLLPLHDAGVRVAGLDAPLTALFRGIDRFNADSPEDDTRFVVELGRQQSHVILAGGREIRFFKTIETGVAQLARAVARKLGISAADADALRRRLIDRPTDPAAPVDPVRQAVFDATRGVAEQLARELALCQRYYSVMFRARPPQRLELAGTGANDPSLHQVFTATLGLETTPLRSPVAAADAGVDLSDGSWAAATGAALKFAPALPPAAVASVDAIQAAGEVARA